MMLRPVVRRVVDIERNDGRRGRCRSAPVCTRRLSRCDEFGVADEEGGRRRRGDRPAWCRVVHRGLGVLERSPSPSSPMTAFDDLGAPASNDASPPRLPGAGREDDERGQRADDDGVDERLEAGDDRLADRARRSSPRSGRSARSPGPLRWRRGRASCPRGGRSRAVPPRKAPCASRRVEGLELTISLRHRGDRRCSG